MKALTKTDFNFPDKKACTTEKCAMLLQHQRRKTRHGSNRSRISAFVITLPEGIPYKGQMLNQIAAKFLDATTDICPNWKMATGPNGNCRRIV